MPTPITIYCVIVAMIAIANARAAPSPSRAETMYQLTDRASWIAGGALTVGIAIWIPWVISTWWKAVVAAPVLVVVCSGAIQPLLADIARVATGTADTPRLKLDVWSRLLTYAVVGILVAWVIRRCAP